MKRLVGNVLVRMQYRHAGSFCNVDFLMSFCLPLFFYVGSRIYKMNTSVRTYKGLFINDKNALRYVDIKRAENVKPGNFPPLFCPFLHTDLCDIFFFLLFIVFAFFRERTHTHTHTHVDQGLQKSET